MVKEDHPLLIKDDQGKASYAKCYQYQLRKQIYELQVADFQVSLLLSRKTVNPLQDLRDLVRATRRDLGSGPSLYW